MDPKVFVGSSTEGQKATVALQRLLKTDLGGKVELLPWTHVFELSATTIESLEKAARDADFAILVFTADDELTLRSEQKKAPRDNVTFELGFFSGRLGRERCYLVEEKESMLRIPTDLLGIASARFERPAQGSWDDALASASSFIAKGIEDRGCKDRLDTEFVTVQKSVQAFTSRVSGYWWERIVEDGTLWLSFFRIDLDRAHNSVRFLEGRGYDSEGRHGSNWDSNVARISLETAQIHYQWVGWYVQARSNEQYHGFGSISFEETSEPDGSFTQARGKFWDVDEAHPEKTTAKPFEMKRAGKDEVQTMKSGPEKARKDLVVKTLAEW
jgi:hypothetical protein